MPIVAWYMLSKESYMKRVMREVLPTRVEGGGALDFGNGDALGGYESEAREEGSLTTLFA